jgi:hypothetical protein
MGLCGTANGGETVWSGPNAVRPAGAAGAVRVRRFASSARTGLSTEYSVPSTQCWVLAAALGRADSCTLGESVAGPPLVVNVLSAGPAKILRSRANTFSGNQAVGA